MFELQQTYVAIKPHFYSFSRYQANDPKAYSRDIPGQVPCSYEGSIKPCSSKAHAMREPDLFCVRDWRVSTKPALRHCGTRRLGRDSMRGR